MSDMSDFEPGLDSDLASDDVHEAVMSLQDDDIKWSGVGFRLMNSCVWIHRNPLLSLSVVAVSFLCGQLCVYFGLTVLLCGVAALYWQPIASDETTQH